MTERELVDGFESGTLANDAFHHADHVHVAWVYVGRYGMPEALARFAAALRRFAAAKGVPGRYHETITWAYLLLVADRRSACPGESWDAFAAANPDLLAWRPSLLDRYYTAETLWSDRARRRFVFPDRAAAAPVTAPP
ncbi:MAG: hypothetical protein AB1635_19065 [Acidobacteriota bacterium]